MSRSVRTTGNVWRMMLVVSIAIAGAVVYPAPASAAQTHCYSSWYTFHHGDNSRNWTVAPNQGAPAFVRANGVPGVDPWYQGLLVCRDLNFGSGYYRLYSNTTSQWLFVNTIGSPRPGQALVAQGGADAYYGLFYICDFDGNFLQIRSVRNNNHLIARSDAGAYLLTTDHSGGSSLFTTTPRLNNLVPWC